MKDLINLLLFQLVWFATVLGVAAGSVWFGAAALGAFIVTNQFLSLSPKTDLKLMGVAVLIGLLIETFMLRVGLLDYVAIAYATPIAPLWILFLWGAFALTLNGCLRWMQGRYSLAAALGAMGGPASYFGGIKIGAATTSVSLAAVLGFVAVVYALVTPFLLWLARKLS